MAAIIIPLLEASPVLDFVFDTILWVIEPTHELPDPMPLADLCEITLICAVMAQYNIGRRQFEELGAVTSSLGVILRDTARLIVLLNPYANRYYKSLFLRIIESILRVFSVYLRAGRLGHVGNWNHVILILLTGYHENLHYSLSRCRELGLHSSHSYFIGMCITLGWMIIAMILRMSWTHLHLDGRGEEREGEEV